MTMMEHDTMQFSARALVRTHSLRCVTPAATALAQALSESHQATAQALVHASEVRAQSMPLLNGSS